MNIRLELSHGERAMLWRAVEQGPLVVGRNPEADLCVPHRDVAPIQCLLRRDGDAVTLLNRSPDGTRVSAEKVEDELRLADGDVVTLGPVAATIRFLASEGSGGRTRTLAVGSEPEEGRVELTLPELFPGRRWELAGGELTVGSDPRNDVVVDDPFVSSFHARFSLEGGRCMVRDLGSRNGVFVGEQKIREGEVPPGAQVKLGRVVAVLVRDEAAGHGERAPAAPGARLVGRSAVMERVRELVRRVAASDIPVLVTGETGTGKEVVAQLVAELSPRAGRPFVAINCGTLSRSLIESELFGHERGAFTGAVARKIGAFEAASRGTLFLDEIGELPLDLQPQLLRALENGEVRRVGSTDPFEVDVRLVAATNRQLEAEVAAGTFREDLFHRLHVLPIELPPLRARLEDIPDLALTFVADLAPAGQSLELTDAAIERLAEHDWPGNVRELRNVLQRGTLMRAQPDRLDAGDIIFTPSTLATRVQTASVTSRRTLKEIERDALVSELRRHRGNKKEAAVALGISRSTMHRKLEDFHIDVEALLKRS
jgi:DNA-binding NtrC family response regulator